MPMLRQNPHEFDLKLMAEQQKNAPVGSGNPGVFEEEIQISQYPSAEALKLEIGRRILARGKGNWDFVDLRSRGSFLYVVFKPRL